VFSKGRLKMGCIGNCLVVTINIAVMAVGLAIVGLSSYVLHLSLSYKDLAGDASDFLYMVPLWTLIGGILLTLICFFGCCGILRKSPCMLRTYGSLVLVLFAVELVCGVLLVVKKDNILEFVRKDMKAQFRQYGSKDKELSNSIDIAEHELECCGVDGYQDWSAIVPDGKSVTKGCCRSGHGIDPNTCYKDVMILPIKEINETIYTRGCFGALKSLVAHESLALGITAIVLAVLQLILMVISFTEAAKYSRHKERYGYNYDGVRS